jgi:hypothetical protein
VSLESLSIVRQDRHEGLGEQHSIVQPRNSAPPSGVREIQVRGTAIVESNQKHSNLLKGQQPLL